MSQSDTLDAEPRQVLLTRTALAEALAWSAWWRTELQRQNRRLSGGWPGTLSEARARVVRRIALEHGPQLAVTAQEVERAARTVYGAARDQWNDHREPEVVDPDDEDAAPVA